MLMTINNPRMRSILEPVWQEMSSLWSGAEFAFQDQSLYGEEPECLEATFQGLAPSSAHSGMEMGRLGYSC